ncbi:nuclear transport factor 2 family protein [Paraburkholderia agricolaris]|uniref:Nuclear transport factor 2 family protein n=1 Tax=Paraburkholderia agricolaris TaxID=2152888 RepID=A0ABW9A0U3_9BURK
MTHPDKAIVQATLADAIGAWASGDSQRIEQVVTDDVSLTSSVHGNVLGKAAVVDALCLNWPQGYVVTLRTTNENFALENGRIVFSGYIYGKLEALPPKRSEPLMFGAVLVGELELGATVWRFNDLALEINWVEGKGPLFSKWLEPRGNRFWLAGDRSPAVVSELNSAWARLPAGHVLGDRRAEVVEVFMRYIWAMDHADFALMRTTLSDDMAGDFPPIGRLTGIHQVIGQLKNFRQAWPWMQHFCEPLNVEIDNETDTAEMLLGRIIAQRPETSAGEKLYGAHYRLKLREDASGWKIFWFEYIEGWVTFTEHSGL